MSPDYVAGQLGAHASSGRTSGTPAPGLHGHQIDSVSVERRRPHDGRLEPHPRQPAADVRRQLHERRRERRDERQSDGRDHRQRRADQSAAIVPNTTAGEAATANVTLRSSPSTSGAADDQSDGRAGPRRGDARQQRRRRTPRCSRGDRGIPAAPTQPRAPHGPRILSSRGRADEHHRNRRTCRLARSRSSRSSTAIWLAFALRRVRRDQRVVLGEHGHAATSSRTRPGSSASSASCTSTSRTPPSRLHERMAAAESRLDGAVAYRALVRYDAYGEMSGHQSTSIALLDARRNGVVLSSILHRDQARLYAKRVDGGVGELELSPEEAGGGAARAGGRAAARTEPAEDAPDARRLPRPRGHELARGAARAGSGRRAARAGLAGDDLRLRDRGAARARPSARSCRSRTRSRARSTRRSTRSRSRPRTSRSSASTSTRSTPA